MRYRPWNVEPHCWDGLIDGETAKRYAAYERDLFVGERPALLVVDAYEKVLGTQTRTPGPDGQSLDTTKVTERIGALLRLFRQSGLAVLHATDVRAIGHRAGSSLSATHRPIPVQDAGPFQFTPPLAPHSGETVVHKMRASAFYGTPLHALLTHGQHDSLVIVGQTTSGCVRASAVDAFSAGLHVTVVEDACFDRFFLSHAVNLFDMHHKYADVISGQIVGELIT